MVGSLLGPMLGLSDGISLGADEGVSLGLDELGSMVGMSVGENDGTFVGGSRGSTCIVKNSNVESAHSASDEFVIPLISSSNTFIVPSA